MVALCTKHKKKTPRIFRRVFLIFTPACLFCSQLNNAAIKVVTRELFDQFCFFFIVEVVCCTADTLVIDQRCSSGCLVCRPVSVPILQEPHHLHHHEYHEAGSRARGEERKVIQVCWWGNGNKTVYFWATHHQLHANPCTKGETANPADTCVRVVSLHPVQRRGRI